MSEDLPPGWLSLRLDAVCTSITDGDHQPPPRAKSGIPFITISAMNDGEINLSRASRYVPNSYYQSLTQDRRARPGDILFSVTGSIGIAALVRTGAPFVFQRHIAVIRPSIAAIEPRFLLYALRDTKTLAGLQANATGTAQLTIPLRALRSHALAIPPLAEQRRIVARIEALFARIRQARADLLRIAPLAKRYRQQSLDRTFRQGALDGWPETPLGEMAVETRNGISAKPADEPPGVPILRISAVRPGRVSIDDVRYHRPESERVADPYLLRDGDLLFVRFNGNADLVAACGVVQGLTAARVYPDKLIRMRLDPSRAIPEFVEAAVATTDARRSLAGSIKTAAGQHGISGADLRNLRVPLPDVRTQELVAADLAARGDSVGKPAHEATRALILLDHLERSILTRAFRGELVSQDRTDEPATALLARLEANGDGAKLRRRAARGG